MQITVHCPQCNKTSTFEHTDRSDTTMSQESKLNVPIPNVKNRSNGLTQLSLAHEDHILLLDVDQNGAVRGTTTVSRVGSELQIAGYIALFAQLLGRVNQKPLLIIIHSSSKTWDHIMNYLLSQFILDNIKRSDNSAGPSLAFNYDEETFQLGVGRYRIVKNTYPRVEEVPPLVIHIFDLDTVEHIDSIPEILDQITKQGQSIKIAFAITSQVIFRINQEKIHRIITQLTQNKINVAISDCSSIDKRIVYLIKVVNEEQVISS